MTKKPQITSLQLLLLAVGSALVFPYTFLPILTAPPANQDMWIVLLLAFVYILVLNAPLLFIMNKCRGLNANQTAETILGKFFGKTVMMLYVLFFMYCYTACMLITAHFITIYLQPATPTWGLMLFMVIPTSYAAIKGAGTIGRLANFIIPFAIFAVIIFLILGFGKMDLNEFLPILADSTFFQLNAGAFLTASRYSEILIFFVFSYYLGQRFSINKAYARALVTFGLCFLAILIPTVLVLGVEYAKLAWNPYYVYTRQVEAFGFLERVQTLNILAWFPTALLKLTVYQYMASHAFSNIVKSKSHKKFVLPVSVIAFAMGLMPFMTNANTLDLLKSDQVFPFVVLPFIIVFPLILVIAYLVRRKKVKPAILKLQEADSAANE